MSYSTKEVWIPIDSETVSLAATATSARIAVKSGTAAIPRGLIYGVHVKVSATHASNTAVPVKLYRDSAGAELHYSLTFDLTSLTQSSDMLATPIPMFDTPYLEVGPIQAGPGSLDYTITYYVKALA
jgi:hypothetical protein